MEIKLNAKICTCVSNGFSFHVGGHISEKIENTEEAREWAMNRYKENKRNTVYHVYSRIEGIAIEGLPNEWPTKEMVSERIKEEAGIIGVFVPLDAFLQNANTDIYKNSDGELSLHGEILKEKCTLGFVLDVNGYAEKPESFDYLGDPKTGKWQTMKEALAKLKQN